jgi:hypothetical protein
MWYYIPTKSPTEYIAVSKGRIRKLEKINRFCKLEDAFNICKKRMSTAIVGG